MANPRPKPYTANTGRDLCCSRKILIPPTPKRPKPQARVFQRLCRTNRAPEAEAVNCTSNSRAASLSRRCHCAESWGRIEPSSTVPTPVKPLQGGAGAPANDCEGSPPHCDLREASGEGRSSSATARHSPYPLYALRSRITTHALSRKIPCDSVRWKAAKAACAWFDPVLCGCYYQRAGWSSPVARWAHNPKVAGSNPAPATNHWNPNSPVDPIHHLQHSLG